MRFRLRAAAAGLALCLAVLWPGFAATTDDQFKSDIEGFLNKLSTTTHGVLSWEGSDSFEMRREGDAAVATITNARLTLHEAKPAELVFDRIEIRRMPALGIHRQVRHRVPGTIDADPGRRDENQPQPQGRKSEPRPRRRIQPVQRNLGLVCRRSPGARIHRRLGQLRPPLDVLEARRCGGWRLVEPDRFRAEADRILPQRGAGRRGDRADRLHGPFLRTGCRRAQSAPRADG